MPVYALNDVAPQLPAPGTYWIAPDAHVIGKVRLAEEVGIWFGAVLRGDNELIAVGARSNIQEHAMLHTDPSFPLTVGENCTVGHHAILHGCTVGDCSLIGMGASVLNGASIGRFCLVGANALVTEGKSFPDYSLIVGSPAKVVRTFEPDIVERLMTSANVYVNRWKAFATGLKRLDP
ncbi:gamma carbonic anhydrase family protein [uncultured Alsobacter sp.]|uniref:gamma carbonic anhydrase family protein n=1 Tax=uncultured Alsobacter sp. TaxID=1748258 RepID=UPI0025F7DBA4|nr:gamma carbonic anhydrase family protein [uncultured Alsobacter sp.]